MKKRNNLAIGAAIAAIVLAAYNTLVFIIFGFSGHTSVFWTSWGFMIAAYLIVALSALFFGKRIRKLRDWMFGYPIIKHGALYLCAELIASIVFIILETVAPFALAFAVQFVIACIFLIFDLSCVIAKNTLDEVRENVSIRTEFIKSMRLKADLLVEKCPDDETRAQFTLLADSLRCSDPVSCDELSSIEEKLSSQMSLCEEALEENDTARALKYCLKASATLSERGKMCKALK